MEHENCYLWRIGYGTVGSTEGEHGSLTVIAPSITRAIEIAAIWFSEDPDWNSYGYTIMSVTMTDCVVVVDGQAELYDVGEPGFKFIGIPHAAANGAI